MVNSIAILTAVIFGSGVMTILAVSFGIVERSQTQAPWRSIIHGVLFGLGAITVMLAPVYLGEGIFFDAHAVVVGMAGAFGGLPAAVLASLLAAAYRAYLGGVGATSGVLGILMAAALGLLWAWRQKLEAHVGLSGNVKLGATISLYTVSAVFLPYPIFVQVAATAIPVIAVCCVIGGILMGSLIERERRYIRSEALWRKGAHTDLLTALPNRRAFMESVQQTLSDCRTGTDNALLILDADNFKSVNDTYGHSAGDAALVMIAERLRSTINEDGSICRLGGEEFAVFLPETSQVAANRIAEMLRLGILDAGLVHDGAAVPLSVSIGVVMHPTKSKATFSRLLQSADVALYRAKERGRNMVVFAEPIAV